MKRHLIFLGVILGILVPCAAQDKPMTVAVLDFVNINGEVSVLGRYFAEASINHLVKNPRFRVVERFQIEQIMAEQDFSSSDYVSEETASRLGRMLGAEAVVMGTLTKTGLHINVNMKFVDTNTGAILSTGKSRLSGSNYRKMYSQILSAATVHVGTQKDVESDLVMNEITAMLEGIDE
jgi:TolB-like protein